MRLAICLTCMLLNEQLSTIAITLGRSSSTFAPVSAVMGPERLLRLNLSMGREAECPFYLHQRPPQGME